MLILASTSPRRKELLGLITKNFTVVDSHADETPAAFTPGETVRQLALRKAEAVASAHPEDTVIGADTVVALDDEILGKPKDPDDARRMLSMLSGRRHMVHTGVAVLSKGTQEVFSEETTVYFSEMDSAMIEAYIATGEPFDKAGGYGIQEKGALFIRRIEGDYYTVVGLPVCRLSQILGKIPHIGNNL